MMEEDQEQHNLPAAVARNFLLHAGSIMVGGLSAVGILAAARKPPSTFHGGELCYKVHLFALYLTALVGSALLYLACALDRFPTAARRTEVVAAAVRRGRRQLIRWVLISRGHGTSLSGFYCCVWFVAAVVYVFPGSSVCFHGLNWLAALFSM